MKIFINLVPLWQSDPVIPAFPDLHLSPAAILKELSMYFQKFSAQTRLLTLPAPHELPPREAQEYPLHHFCYLLVIYYNMSFLELPPPPQKKKLCLNLYKGNITILVNFLIKKKSKGRRRREVEISWYSQHMFWHWIFGFRPDYRNGSMVSPCCKFNKIFWWDMDHVGEACNFHLSHCWWVCLFSKIIIWEIWR